MDPGRPSRDGRSSTEHGPGVGFAVYAGAALCLAASLIHLWMMPGHFAEWWAYGAYYLIVASLQGLFGVSLLRWPGKQALVLVGIWTNLAVVVLYVLTRTRGLPFGPHAGVVEQTGLLDLGTTAAELGLVVALASLLRGAYRRWTVNALLILGAALWASRLFGILP